MIQKNDTNILKTDQLNWRYCNENESAMGNDFIFLSDIREQLGILNTNEKLTQYKKLEGTYTNNG